MTAALNKGELFASFDVDAFEVPHGRDELWRFTPLRRLRGLHDGSAKATGSAQIAVSEQNGVRVETVRRGDERLGQGGVPADRVAAQAFSSFNSATLVTIGRDTQVGEPVNITITGPAHHLTVTDSDGEPLTSASLARPPHHPPPMVPPCPGPTGERADWKWYQPFQPKAPPEN